MRAYVKLTDVTTYNTSWFIFTKLLGMGLFRFLLLLIWGGGGKLGNSYNAVKHSF